MTWTPEKRIDMARTIALVLQDEARGVIMSRRVYELSELILFVLSMPESFLNANYADKYSEFEA